MITVIGKRVVAWCPKCGFATSDPLDHFRHSARGEVAECDGELWPALVTEVFSDNSHAYYRACYAGLRDRRKESDMLGFQR